MVPTLVYADSCGAAGACAKSACGRRAKKACAAKVECTAGTCAKTGGEAKTDAHASVAEISTPALATLLRSGKPTVLDARTGKYDDGRRIPGAKSLSPEADAKEAAKQIPSKDSLVVTYCSNTQCPASGRLAKRLLELGYNNILEYPEGIAGWQQEGNQVEEVKL